MSPDQAWLRTVEELWPGARVEPCGPSGPGGAAPHAGRLGASVLRRELVFLPDARQPRALLPAGLPSVASAALRRYSHDLSPRRRMSRSLSATVVRTGLPERALRDRLRVSGGGESIEDRLSELIGSPVVVSVSLGSARANRKPILHVLTPAGRPVAFVKVGNGPVARGLIAGEARALEILAGRPPEGIAIPRVLMHDAWAGMDLLVLSALPTSARGWRPRRQAPVAAMRALQEVAGIEHGTLEESAFWAAIRAVPDVLPDRGRADLLAEVIEKIGASFAGDSLAFGAWHGDWTSWNMAWHRGRVQLWDFERFAHGVPCGFDLLHYRLQEMRGSTLYETWPDGLQARLAPLGITGRAAYATLHLYLLELCCRYQRAAVGPVGEPLRPQADRLLELLNNHAGSIQ